MNRTSVYSLLSVLIALLLVGCATNQTLRYFEGAEVQLSGDAQRATLIQALDDALTLPSEELAAKRYPDYKGKKGQWDLQAVIERYVMPDAKGKSLDGDFYEDVKSRAVQKRIRQLLIQLRGRQGK